MAAADTAPAVRPILKWAGGKRQLLPALRPYYPRTFARYFEPFLGSGAVFLDCHNARLLDGREVRLSDTNADIIGCYLMVRDAVEETIAALRALDAGHRDGGGEHFYDVRDRRFNPLRERVHRLADPSVGYTPELAAMLVYLNRTGYNGLFRLNSKGGYNVPVGRYSSPVICDEPNLRRVSSALRQDGVSVGVRPFEAALAEVGDGDFVYLDPPYAPLSRTARFTAYTASQFGPEQQAALQQSVVRAAGAGALIVLSNSSAPQIRELYVKSADARRAGLRARTVPARRAINSKASARGVISEYVISNIPRTAGLRESV